MAPDALGKVPEPGLAALDQAGASRGCVLRGMRVTLCSFNHGLQVEPCCPGMVLPIRSQGAPIGDGLFRSEEHTSELQSLMRTSYAVFCLTKKQPTPTQSYT